MDNKEQIDSFVEGIQKNTLPQTFLITGSYGVGQVFFITEVLSKIITKNNQQVNKMILSLDNDKSKIEKSEVEKAKLFLEQSPLVGDKKVLVIYDADFLSIESQNLILKSIEEPKKSSLIFLVSNYNNILSTIKSRSYIIDIKPNLEIKDLRMGFMDIDLGSLEKNILDYLGIYNQPLVVRSKYIEKISTLSYKELGDIIWIYETLYRLVYLNLIDNNLYNKYMSEYISNDTLRSSVQDFVNQNSYLYALQKLDKIQDNRDKIFFTNAKKSLLLEQILF